MIYANVSEFGTIKLDYKKSTVSDSIKYETIKFKLPKDWEELTKTVVFRNDKQTLSVVLDGSNSLCISEDECYIPHEMLTSDEFTVSVFGESSDRRATTKKATITVEKSGYGEGDAPSDPTPTEYQQLVSISNETKSIASNAKEIADSLREDADNGVFKGAKGDKGDKGDKGEAFIYEDFTSEQLAALKGEKGDTGDTGPQGEKGETGPRGPQGLQGLKGDKGDRGDKGEKGDAFTYEDFTDKQLILLKGDKGDKGEQGDVSKDYLEKNFASVIQNTKRDNVIVANDVSSVPHELNIRLSSDTLKDFSEIGITICGKNILPYPYDETSRIEKGITIIDNGDGSVTLNGTATSNLYFRPTSNLLLMPGVYTLSGTPENLGLNKAFVYTYETDNPNIVYNAYNNSITFTVDTPTVYSVRIVVVEGTTLRNDTFKIQLELNSNATTFESYNGTMYTSNTNGMVENAMSISPNMSIIADTTGIVISCKYNADTKKYIDNKISELLSQ